MPATFEGLGLALNYNSAEADLVTEFYLPCLQVAQKYDRAAGYFRSSVLNLVGVAMSDFALRGGKMRLICSPDLSEQDCTAMLTAEQATVESAVSGELEAVLRHPENIPVVELMATLIRFGGLEIKLAYKPGERGIFHDKLGILYGEGDQVSFTGSANETFMAWDPSGNHEAFETFGSWDEGDSRRVERHRIYFGALWDDRMPSLRIRSLPQVPADVLASYVNPDGVEAAVEKARAHLRRMGRTRGITRKVLQAHQVDVVENWKMERRGIIDHATGAGKTVSALSIVRFWLEESRGHAVLILVPSDLLSQQWFREVNRELGDLQPKMLPVGGDLSLSSWRDSLSAFTGTAPIGPRVVIATMQTASSGEFLDRVQMGEHLLVVADEAHRIGSRRNRRALSIDAGGRLALSATPARENDPEGTAAIFEYFGEVLDPPFGIADAIRAGRLVPYDYFIHTVELNEEEETEYRRLSRRIAEIVAQSSRPGAESRDDQIDMLRIRRARIVKKASAKLPCAIELLSRDYCTGQRWLVYCEDIQQLDDVRRGLRDNGIENLEYHRKMIGDPAATLRSFERHGGVLVSIRCLDEGVDIPIVDNALILASSTNSREYIQRRGRVLRSAPGKYSATVHDVLVCEKDAGRLVVMNRDYDRAREFAANARNDSCRFRLDALSSRDEPGEAFEVDDAVEGE